MNPAEQRRRATVVDQLASDVETVLDGFSKEIFARLEVETARRKDALGVQRAYVDDKLTALRTLHERLWESVLEFQHRGFWGRLNWLVTGR